MRSPGAFVNVFIVAFLISLAPHAASLNHRAAPKLGVVDRQSGPSDFSNTVAAFTVQIGNATAKDIIRFNNRVLSGAIISRSIGGAETPAQIYLLTKTTVAMWEPHAACNAKALGFFGDKVPIGPHLCATPDAIHATAGILLHRVYLPSNPAEAANIAALLTALRVPNDDLLTTNTSTPQGWANARARTLLNYFDNDGWNARGDRTRKDNRRPFSDPTGYRPVNPPQSDTRFPLRWVPLTVQADLNGRYYTQVHSYAHIGWIAHPLVVATSDLHARSVDGPYVAPDARDPDAEDEKAVRAGLRDLLRRQTNMTRQQRYEAAWWESKLISLGLFAGVYEEVLDLDEFTVLRIGMGDVLAQHDAVVMAWRAKRAHDLVRPPTMMHRLLGGTRASAYIRGEDVVREIDLADWEPLLPAQPHSEFPSGSAAICRASLEHLNLAVEALVGKGNVPPLELDVSSFIGLVGLPPPFKVRYETLEEAYRACGESRLTAGVHFAPAIEAGYVIVEGFGRAAFEHMSDLVAGKIPKNCERCFRK